VPLFIALEGMVSICRTGEDDKILAVRAANEFTGEMSVNSVKHSILKARHWRWLRPGETAIA